MKFPSLQRIVAATLTSINRFPLEIITAIIGTATAIYLVELDYHDQNPDIKQNLLRLVFCCVLGLSLFLSISVFAENRKWSSLRTTLLRGSGFVVIVVIYILLDPLDNEINAFRYGFLFVAFHLLVAFAPFLRSSHVNAFWEYNKRLFLRFLLSGLYSGVLFAGLAIAIVSTDALFNLDINERIYAQLFFFVAGIFNTCFFLAGVPDNWEELEAEQSYPKGLKVFTQYVLIPLAIVYLIILLAYEIKVIVEWTLPKGLVASLVLGYAVYGTLSILLIYPIRNNDTDKWIKTFSKWFYLLLIPLIVLLAIAVWQRVDQYGITESRYILVVLSLWLTGITVYFLLNSEYNIKIIPISLCVLALLSTWGPQSATGISTSSQLNRLLKIFEENKAFTNGKLSPLPSQAEKEDHNNAYDIVYFLVERHGTKPLEQYLSMNLDSVNQKTDTIKYRYTKVIQKADAIREALKLDNKYGVTEDEYYYASASHDALPVQGYDYIQELTYYDYDSKKLISWNPDSLTITIAIDNQRLMFPLNEIVEKVMQDEKQNRQHTYKMEELSIEGKDSKSKLYTTEISVRKKSEKVVLVNFRGFLLFSKD